MTSKPIIFLGPPGTGKTTKLLDVVLWEMEHGVPPDRIGYMTFTRKGVEEAITRASERFDQPRSNFRYFNTLHAAAYRFLGLNSAQVLDRNHLEQFSEAHPEFEFQIYGRYTDDGAYTRSTGDDRALFVDNFCRNSEEPLELLLDREVSDKTRYINLIEELRNYKQEQGLYDFTDMIEEFNRYDSPPLLEVLIIDEAQDLSNLQWRMVEILSRHVKRFYIAGDDDQSIFTWAGASDKFIDMPGDIRLLEQSWRVPNVVHTLANKIVQRIMKRREKEWLPRKEEGFFAYANELADLSIDTFSQGHSVMMLARTGRLLKHMMRYCIETGIPFSRAGHPSIKIGYAIGIITWERLMRGESVNSVDAMRVYDLLPSNKYGQGKGIDPVERAKLRNISKGKQVTMLNYEDLKRDYGLKSSGPWESIFTEIDSKEVEYIQRCKANGFNIIDRPNVIVSTIHRVKGGQADTVILMSDQEKVVTEGSIETPDSEARVFYTAVTRTYQNLIVLQPRRTYYYEGLF